MSRPWGWSHRSRTARRLVRAHVPQQRATVCRPPVTAPATRRTTGTTTSTRCSALYAQDKWTLNRLTLTYGAPLRLLQRVRAGTVGPGRPVHPARPSAASRLRARAGTTGRAAPARPTTLRHRQDGAQDVGRQVPRAGGAGPCRIAESARRPVRHAHLERSDRNGTSRRGRQRAGPGDWSGVTSNFGVPAGAPGSSHDAASDELGRERVGRARTPATRRRDRRLSPHRDFQNQTITRNVAIDSVNDYRPYTFTGPLSPATRRRYRADHVYNLLLAKNGVVNSVSTFSTKNTRVYNGFEVSVNARLPRSGFLLGGVTTERTATNDCDLTNVNPDNGASAKRFRPPHALQAVGRLHAAVRRAGQWFAPGGSGDRDCRQLHL